MSGDVARIVEARPREVGGFRVGRVLPAVAQRAVGPFVFLDHMGPADVPETGFAVRPHPHIHLATVTYLFDGEVFHRDSVGSAQLITPGAINWMTAGTGIVHSERSPVPRTTSRVHGLQLWVGLPKRHEDSAPAFHHTPASAIPQIEDAGVQLRVLAGTAFGATSPVRTLSPMFYVEARLEPGARVPMPADHVDRAAYVIDGELAIGDSRITSRQLVVFERGATPVLEAVTAARVALLGGEPLDGPRYIWWNFVSSSADRIIEAAHAWRAQQFATIPGDDRERIPAPEDDPRFAKEQP